MAIRTAACAASPRYLKPGRCSAARAAGAHKARGHSGARGRGVKAAVRGPRGRAARRHLRPLFLCRSQGHFPQGCPGKTSPLITENSPSSLLPEPSLATLGLGGAGPQHETGRGVCINAACERAARASPAR